MIITIHQNHSIGLENACPFVLNKITKLNWFNDDSRHPMFVDNFSFSPKQIIHILKYSSTSIISVLYTIIFYVEPRVLWYNPANWHRYLFSVIPLQENSMCGFGWTCFWNFSHHSKSNGYILQKNWSRQARDLWSKSKFLFVLPCQTGSIHTVTDISIQ